MLKKPLTSKTFMGTPRYADVGGVLHAGAPIYRDMKERIRLMKDKYAKRPAGKR